MEPERLVDDLARSDYESLRHVSFARHALDEAERLGDDATYALGLIYLGLNIDDVGEGLLELASERAPEPWRSEAYSVLLARLIRSERFEAAEALARREPERIDAALSLLESLYEQRRFADVESALQDARRRLDELDPAGPEAAEVALWRAVSLVELDRPTWPEAVRELYRAFPAGEAHSRVWIYLTTRPGLIDAFSPEEASFFEAKHLLAEGRAGEATDLFARLAAAVGEAASGASVGDDAAAADASADDDAAASDDAAVSDAPPAAAPIALVRAPWSLLDLYRAGASSGRTSVAARALRSLARGAAPETSRRALEYAGRLYRLAGAYAAAITLLEESLALHDPGPDERRVRWYRHSSALRRDPIAFAGELPAIVPTLTDPAYYGDILFELAGLLAEREAWTVLHQAYEAIAGFAPAGTRARYEIALARALEAGLIAGRPAAVEELRMRYLQRAYAQRDNLFAALLAGTLLGYGGVELLGIDEDAVDPSDAASPSHAASPSRAALLAGTYLRFGLVDELFALLRRGDGEIPATLRLDAAQRLAGDGRVRESVLILNELFRSEETASRRAALLRYPLAYAAIIDGRVADEELDRALFYALIREESLFDPLIGSSAGAFGLSQLMAATADDIARRMRMQDPDLSDPADNLAIGARYFAMLNDQFGTPVRALAAYNAGQGNVRRWERAAAVPDEVLFHQVIPFPETYDHVRKVVVSASYYGYLYENRAPRETIRLVFNLD